MLFENSGVNQFLCFCIPKRHLKIINLPLNVYLYEYFTISKTKMIKKLNIMCKIAIICQNKKFIAQFCYLTAPFVFFTLLLSGIDILPSYMCPGNTLKIMRKTGWLFELKSCKNIGKMPVYKKLIQKI